MTPWAPSLKLNGLPRSRLLSNFLPLSRRPVVMDLDRVALLGFRAVADGQVFALELGNVLRDIRPRLHVEQFHVEHQSLSGGMAGSDPRLP